MSLDLKNASTAQRNDFDARLKERGWVKLSGVDTVWCGRFGQIANNEDGIKEVRNHIARAVKDAAAVGKVEQVKYVVQIQTRPRSAGSSGKKEASTHIAITIPTPPKLNNGRVNQ